MKEENIMQKPQEPYWIGNHDDYSYNEFENKILGRKIYLHDDCDSEEDFKEYYCDQNELKIEECPPIELWGYDTEIFTMKELLEIVPDNVDKNDVVISVHRDRQINHIEVLVSVRVPVDKEAWQAAHDAEKADYERRYAAYKEELAAYDKWETEQEIKRLQDKLAKIKK